MQVERRIDRTIVDIPVTVSTVLETTDATIADLSEFGALIHGVRMETGRRFQLDYLGQTVFAQCCWSEVDRMGAKFLFPINEGPLYERLLVARAGRNGSGISMAFAPPHGRMPGAAGRTFGRRG